jgi:HEPN domain-containing protein
MRRETELWIDDADYDLESAKAMLDSGRYFFVVFMCHLTVEKLLKAVIVERHGAEPPKIHNLVALAVRVGLTIPNDHLPLVNELDNMSVVTRYPDGRRSIAGMLTPERTSEIYDRTVRFSEWLRQELGSSEQ